MFELTFGTDAPIGGGDGGFAEEVAVNTYRVVAFDVQSCVDSLQSKDALGVQF